MVNETVYTKLSKLFYPIDERVVYPLDVSSGNRTKLKYLVITGTLS